MPPETMEVGVVVECRRLKSAWQDYAWVPVAVLAGTPAAASWTVLDETPELTRYYAGSFQLEFHRADTATYRENLHSGRPSLWVSLRVADTAPGVVLQNVTADPAEGEALTEPGTDFIEAVAMPPEVQQRLAAFVALHHVERAFFKRQRDRADPEALGTRTGRRGSSGNNR